MPTISRNYENQENVIVYDSLADAVADTSLDVGYSVKTLGYYSENDGGGADYIVVAGGTGTPDGGSYHDMVNGNQLELIPKYPINIEVFGSVENADSSANIRAAISYAGANGILIPSKRFIYDGAVITDSVVSIHGERMPYYKSGFTGLENGSIIEGTLSLSGLNIDLRNFGVDLGTDTSAPVGDGIKCTASVLNGGEHLHVENLISLGKNPSDAFHALLFESYQKVTGGNIHGINTFFSCVFKCHNINLTSVYGCNSEKRGLYFKSDNVFGSCGEVNVDSIIIDGNGQTGQGLYIQSDGDKIEKINIDSYLCKGYNTGIELNNTPSAVGINDIQIGKAIISETSEYGLISVASNGFMFNLHIEDLSVLNCTGKIIETFGETRHFKLGGLYANFSSSATQLELDNAVHIVTEVRNTQFDNIIITKNGTVDEADKGTIVYDNLATTNQIGNRHCFISGVGAPEYGVSIITGTPTTLEPVDNVKNKNTSIVTQISSGTTITRIENERSSGVQFETGTILNVINESTSILRIDHDPSNNIRNKGSVQVVLGGTDAAQYVLANTGIWTEV